jgi:Ca2+-binding EF-hand superfamily protein
LLRNVFYFNKAWVLFDIVDREFAASGEKEMDFEEFQDVLGLMSLDWDESRCIKAYNRIDTSGDNSVSYGEFSLWLAEEMCSIGRVGPGRARRKQVIDENDVVRAAPVVARPAGDRASVAAAREREKNAEAARAKAAAVQNEYSEAFGELESGVRKLVGNDDAFTLFLRDAGMGADGVPLADVAGQLASLWPELEDLEFWDEVVERIYAEVCVEAGAETESRPVLDEERAREFVRNLPYFARLWQVLLDKDIDLELTDNPRIDPDELKDFLEAYGAGVDTAEIDRAFPSLLESDKVANRTAYTGEQEVSFDVIALWLADRFSPRALAEAGGAGGGARTKDLTPSDHQRFLSWSAKAVPRAEKWKSMLQPTIDFSLLRVDALVAGRDFDADSPWSSASDLDGLRLGYARRPNKALMTRKKNIEDLRERLDRARNRKPKRSENMRKAVGPKAAGPLAPVAAPASARRAREVMPADAPGIMPGAKRLLSKTTSGQSQFSGSGPGAGSRNGADGAASLSARNFKNRTRGGRAGKGIGQITAPLPLREGGGRRPEAGSQTQGRRQKFGGIVASNRTALAQTSGPSSMQSVRGGRALKAAKSRATTKAAGSKARRRAGPKGGNGSTPKAGQFNNGDVHPGAHHRDWRDDPSLNMPLIAPRREQYKPNLKVHSGIFGKPPAQYNLPAPKVGPHDMHAHQIANSKMQGLRQKEAELAARERVLQEQMAKMERMRRKDGRAMR